MTSDENGTILIARVLDGGLASRNGMYVCMCVCDACVCACVGCVHVMCVRACDVCVHVCVCVC